MKHGLLIRRLAAILAPALLAGCLSPARAPLPEPEALVSKQALSKVTQPLLYARIPKLGAAATLAIAGQNGGVTTWRTGDGVSLSMRDGIIVATRGLGNDLMSADVSGSEALLHGSGPPGHVPRLHSYLDGENQTQFRAFQCKAGMRRRETIEIAGRSHAAMRIDEDCTAPGRRVRNTYWRAGGVTLKSRQWISPAVGYVETLRLVR